MAPSAISSSPTRDSTITSVKPTKVSGDNVTKATHGVEARDDLAVKKADGIINPGGDGHLIHPSLVTKPIMVQRAKGSHLHLANGGAVIDASGGAAVASIGHGNDEVHEAIANQVKAVSYLNTQVYTSPVAEELANIVVDSTPAGLDMALFVGSGSDAVDAALKLARQYHWERNEPQRLHLVSRRQAYHGNTMGSMSVSTNIQRKLPYDDFTYQHVSHVSPAFPYHYQNDGETEEEYTQRLCDELDEEFQRVGPEKVVAFICEPVVGVTAGCVVPPKGYLKGVKAVCEKYGILLILDEIMCGSGRCGTFFSFEQDDVMPDIVTMAKGLSGGYAPVAGILAHNKVTDVLRNGSTSYFHGHTWQAHPSSCAAALQVQKIIRRDNLIERCARMGNLLEEQLRTELADLKSVGDIRGRGLFWAVEFVKDKKTKESFDPAIGFGLEVMKSSMVRGVSMIPGSGTVDGYRGDHVMLCPPYTIAESDIKKIVSVLKEAIIHQEKKHFS